MVDMIMAVCTECFHKMGAYLGCSMKDFGRFDERMWINVSMNRMKRSIPRVSAKSIVFSIEVLITFNIEELLQKIQSSVS